MRFLQGRTDAWVDEWTDRHVEAMQRGNHMMQRCLAVVKSHSCNPQTTKEDAFKRGNGMSFGFRTRNRSARNETCQCSKRWSPLVVNKTMKRQEFGTCVTTTWGHEGFHFLGSLYCIEAFNAISCKFPAGKLNLSPRCRQNKESPRQESLRQPPASRVGAQSRLTRWLGMRYSTLSCSGLPEFRAQRGSSPIRRDHFSHHPCSSCVEPLLQVKKKSGVPWPQHANTP